jgi:hypothetical protein
MPERSALYFELQDVLHAGGCPVCNLGRRASDSYLHSLIYEGVTDPDLRQKLRDARGLCHRHAWRLAHERGSTLGVSIIYHDVVNTLARILEEEEAGGTRRKSNRQALLGRLGPIAECPACQLERDAIPRAAKTLLKHLDEPELEGAFQAAGGLCLPHTKVVLAQANDDQARTVQRWQLEIYRKLREQLGEFIRKNDHRFQGEAIGAEADAGERAVLSLVGIEEP